MLAQSADGFHFAPQTPASSEQAKESSAVREYRKEHHRR
jgi:hypothetical protein